MIPPEQFDSLERQIAGGNMTPEQSHSLERAGELLEMAVDNPGIDAKVLVGWLTTAADRIKTVAKELDEEKRKP